MSSSIAELVKSKTSIALEMYMSELASYFKQNDSPWELSRIVSTQMEIAERRFTYLIVKICFNQEVGAKRWHACCT